MTREELEATLAADGWQKDRFGHYKKSVMTTGRKGGPMEGRQVERMYRVKMRKISCRVEVRSATLKTAQWFPLTSGYYKNAMPLEDGRYRIGTMIMGKGAV